MAPSLNPVSGYDYECDLIWGECQKSNFEASYACRYDRLDDLPSSYNHPSMGTGSGSMSLSFHQPHALNIKAEPSPAITNVPFPGFPLLDLCD